MPSRSLKCEIGKKTMIIYVTNNVIKQDNPQLVGGTEAGREGFQR